MAKEEKRRPFGMAQIIYTLLVISIVIPLLNPVGLPIGISSTTRDVYNYIENTLPAGKPVLIDLYYEMAARAELEPQVAAVIKHLFEKNCKLVFVSTITYGPIVFELLKSTAADLFADKTYGVDYVFLGYIAGNEPAVRSLATSIRGTVAVDNYGTAISALQMMANIDKAEDFALVFIASSGTDTFGWYVRQWYTPYDIPLLFGALSVIGPSIKPYVDAGQAIGMLTGQRSAAEYETLVGRKGLGLASMDAQSFAHALILIFIIIGNIILFATRSKPKPEGGRRK
ncbi:MAG: hypothetical protein QHH12_07515 [Candidatus Bathyarchaeota archaeon]|jgi:hypothetical protein|nr:hypothetical protein [Candidatus Bathyarchaeota archaeon A05DMB-3]MDH7607586.1 hypothetical protein [Candidatus Bathyarchaeota archaeon]